MARASECNSISCVIVPADGTRAATIRNGDFGTSPFFGQLADKLLLALTCACGVWSVNHNSGVEKLCVEHLQGLRRGPRVMSYGGRSGREHRQHRGCGTEPYTPPSYCRIYSALIASSLVLISGLSCKTTFNKELRTSSFPLYSMKPNLRNLFMKKLTRDRVVPIISASVS
jgi:hypothetical protein